MAEQGADANIDNSLLQLVRTVALRNAQSVGPANRALGVGIPEQPAIDDLGNGNGAGGMKGFRYGPDILPALPSQGPPYSYVEVSRVVLVRGWKQGDGSPVDPFASSGLKGTAINPNGLDQGAPFIQRVGASTSVTSSPIPPEYSR